MRHFTNSFTFDVNFLINGEPGKKDHRTTKRDFSNSSIFDVKNLMDMK